MATRQCSMMVIESLNNLMKNLIGGSADLSGSNNTKASNSKVINHKSFDGNYIHYGVREHGMAASNEWYSVVSQSSTIWRNIFNFFRLLQASDKIIGTYGLKSNLYFFT